MNHDDVLAVLPDRREDAKSIKEIAQAMGLAISGWVACDEAKRRRPQILVQCLLEDRAGTGDYIRKSVGEQVAIMRKKNYSGLIWSPIRSL